MCFISLNEVISIIYIIISSSSICIIIIIIIIPFALHYQEINFH